MRSIRSAPLSLAALATLAALAPAAPLAPIQGVRAADPALLPLRAGELAGWHHRLDWATGELVTVAGPPGGAAGARAAVDCFTNDASPGNSSHPVAHQELVDWGVKSCGASGLVESFTFAYRTDHDGVSTPVECSVAFYLGTTGFGNLGTEVRRFSFSGLPGGFNTVHFVTVDVHAAPLVLPDGPIGWSFTNDDVGSGGAFGGSGTILAYAPDFTLQTVDALMVYDDPPAPTGTYTGTFNFGPGTHVGSIWMTLDEDDGTTPATTALRFGSGVNPSVFFPLTPPRLGTSWNAIIDTASFPGTAATAIAMSTAPTPPLPSPLGEVLVDPSRLVLVDVSNAAHSVGLPLNLDLVGLTAYTQGVIAAPSGVRLTNAVDITIGF